MKKYSWNNHYVDYCHHCEGFIIQCESCKNWSCTGGGCDVCCGKDGEKKLFNIFSENYKMIAGNWIVPPYEKSPEEIMLDEIFLAKTSGSVIC
jgi:hypothetical protein